MAINEEVLPPAYDEVIRESDVSAPSAPSIAVALPPVSPTIHGASIGFDVLHEPPSAKQEEAKGFANPIPAAGPGYDPEDDIIAPVTENTPTLEQRGNKREFVIRLTCPSCDCSNLVPHSGNLTCCTPDLGFLNKLKYMNDKKVEKFFPNWYWSKVTDRHFRYFFRKPENVEENFARFINFFLFAVFLVISTVMFVITPWVALIPAILLPCEQNAAIKPLLGTLGAVALAESFMRSFCYILHKIDRPPRAIKELESPNALFFIMLGLIIAIFVNIAGLVPCNNSTVSLIPSTGDGTCCDPLLISVTYGVSISWLVFQVLVVMLGTSLKALIEF